MVSQLSIPPSCTVLRDPVKGTFPSLLLAVLNNFIFKTDNQLHPFVSSHDHRTAAQ